MACMRLSSNVIPLLTDWWGEHLFVIWGFSAEVKGWESKHFIAQVTCQSIRPLIIFFLKIVPMNFISTDSASLGHKWGTGSLGSPFLFYNIGCGKSIIAVNM